MKSATCPAARRASRPAARSRLWRAAAFAVVLALLVLLVVVIVRLLRK